MAPGDHPGWLGAWVQPQSSLCVWFSPVMCGFVLLLEPGSEFNVSLGNRQCHCAVSYEDLIPWYLLSVLHRRTGRNALFPMLGLFSVDTAHVSAGSYILILPLFTLSYYTFDKFSIIIVTFYVSYIIHFLLLGIHVPFRGIFLIQVLMSVFFFLFMIEFRSCPPWLRT